MTHGKDAQRYASWTRLACGPVALGALAFFAVGAGHAAEPVGHVATLAGSATATGTDGSRTLACGDPVFSGDTLATADASHVGLLMGDTLAHLASTSELFVGERGVLRLEEGKVRLLDAVSGDDVHELAALDTTATNRGNDSEAYIFKEKTGRYSMHCEWDEPLPVTRGAETRVAQPGQCVIAKNGEPLYPADAHEDRIGPVDEGPCAGEIPFGPVADRFPPFDVGAGPPLPFAFELPSGSTAPTPDPCDQPGSGCFGSVAATATPTMTPPAGPPPPPPPVVEPPPTGGGIPGL